VPLGTRVRAAVVWAADGCHDGEAVVCHLGVLFDDVLPAVLIEDHQSLVGICDLGERALDAPSR
jgi:hypothetical protein